MHEDARSKEHRVNGNGTEMGGSGSTDAKAKRDAGTAAESHSTTGPSYPETVGYDKFAEKCLDRMLIRHAQYGSSTHEKLDLLREIEQEILDMSNYSFFMWLRVQKLVDKWTQVKLLEEKLDDIIKSE